jgi:hypothetical protein
MGDWGLRLSIQIKALGCTVSALATLAVRMGLFGFHDNTTPVRRTAFPIPGGQNQI